VIIVVLALDRPLGHAVLGVAADRGVLLPLGVLVPLDVLSRVAPCGRPGSGVQFGQGPQDRGQVAAGERGGVDGTVGAPAQVAAEVAEAQVVGGGEPIPTAENPRMTGKAAPAAPAGTTPAWARPNETDPAMKQGRRSTVGSPPSGPATADATPPATVVSSEDVPALISYSPS
jgi:hypothetical protein